MYRPLVAVYEAHESLQQALEHLTHPVFSSDIVCWQTTKRLRDLKDEYEHGQIPTFIAQAKFRIVLEQIQRQFDLPYHPTWENFIEPRFDFFDGCYDYLMWTIYVSNNDEVKTVYELIDFNHDVDPVDLCNAARNSVEFLALEMAGLIYVFRSPEIAEGLHAPKIYMPAMPIDLLAVPGMEGGHRCFVMPSEVLQLAEEFNQWEELPSQCTQTPRLPSTGSTKS